MHPRLFFSPKDVDSAVKRYASDPSFFAAYLPKDNELDKTPVLFSDGETANQSAPYLARLAAAYVLTKDKKYSDALMRWLPVLQAYEPLTFKSVGGENHHDLVSGTILVYLAITYDVLYNRCDPQLQQALKNALLVQGKADYEGLTGMRKVSYEQNHFTIPCSGLAVASMVLADESPDAKKWAVYATNTLKRTFSVFAPDAWYYEGPGYWIFTFQYLIPAAAALKETTGEDLFSQAPLNNVPYYLANMFLPNPNFTFDFSDCGPRVEQDKIHFQKGYDLPWHTRQTHIIMLTPMFIEREHPDPLLENFIQTEGPISFNDPRSSVFNIFWQMPLPGPPTPMKDGPVPYHYFPDMEIVHWRNSWSDSNATALAFKSGPPAGHHETLLLPKYPEWVAGVGHAHPDAGTFAIYSKGVFLVGSDTAYVGIKETGNASSILVDGIGQAQGGTAWATFNDRPYDVYDKIHMADVWLGSKIAASTAVFDTAYRPGLKITKMERQLVLVDGRYALIRDTIASDAPHQYEFRLQIDKPPANPAPNRFVLDNGAGRLIIQSLVPIDSFKTEPTIVETEITATNPPRPQQRGFHLSLQSPAGRNDFQFLTALDIQSSQDSADAFTAKNLKSGAVEFADDAGTCAIWTKGNSNLVGSYAYVLGDKNNKIMSAGLYGQSLKTEDIQIELKNPGHVSIRLNGQGKWETESYDGGANELLIKAKGSADQTLPLS